MDPNEAKHLSYSYIFTVKADFLKVSLDKNNDRTRISLSQMFLVPHNISSLDH